MPDADNRGAIEEDFPEPCVHSVLQRGCSSCWYGEWRRTMDLAQEVVYWVGNMPSREAVIAGANAEHNQVYGKGDDPWHNKSGESQRHWLGHVEPAVREAFRREMELTAPPGHPFRKLVAALEAR